MGSVIVVRSDALLEPLPFPPSTVGATDPDASGVRQKPRQPVRRVLIVDDEPLVGTALKRVLAHHDVTVVASGAAAISVIDVSDSFDVVICDVMMPGMSGPRVYEIVSAAHPEMRSRFVFITGGVPHEGTRLFLASVPNQVLYKPFDLCAVRDAVRDVGDAGDRAA